MSNGGRASQAHLTDPTGWHTLATPLPSHENEEQPLSGPAGLTPTQEATIPVKFDSQTLERFRRMTPQEIYREVTDALHQAPGGLSGHPGQSGGRRDPLVGPDSEFRIGRRGLRGEAAVSQRDEVFLSLATTVARS